MIFSCLLQCLYCAISGCDRRYEEAQISLDAKNHEKSTQVEEDELEEEDNVADAQEADEDKGDGKEWAK